MLNGFWILTYLCFNYTIDEEKFFYHVIHQPSTPASISPTLLPLRWVEKEIDGWEDFFNQIEHHPWGSKRSRTWGLQRSCHGNHNLATPEESIRSSSIKASVLGEYFIGAEWLSFHLITVIGSRVIMTRHRYMTPITRKIKTIIGASNMAQWVKALSTKPGGLSSTLKLAISFTTWLTQVLGQVLNIAHDKKKE